MGWLFLTVVLLLTETADAGRIVVTCYDGASSAGVRWGPLRSERSELRIGACDVDGRQDGRCQFRVSLAGVSTVVSRLFEVNLAGGQRRRLRYAGTKALLRCRTGPEPKAEICHPEAPPNAVTFTCRDAVLADSTTDPACDIDRVCDDSCSFGFRCPTCCECGAPCFEQPVYEVPVRVGCRQVLPACDRGLTPARVLECQPRPMGISCPSTTTTLPRVGSCRTADDCTIFPPACQHCELGRCQGMPTLHPNRSISAVFCVVPQ